MKLKSLFILLLGLLVIGCKTENNNNSEILSDESYATEDERIAFISDNTLLLGCIEDFMFRQREESVDLTTYKNIQFSAEKFSPYFIVFIKFNSVETRDYYKRLICNLYNGYYTNCIVDTNSLLFNMIIVQSSESSL